MPGLAVSGRYFIQHVTPSLISGAGGTTPGGGVRRLLRTPTRGLLQSAPVVNASTTAGQAELTATNLNNFLSGSTGRRKLLQTQGLEIAYACVPPATSAACLPPLARWAPGASASTFLICDLLMHITALLLSLARSMHATEPRGSACILCSHDDPEYARDRHVLAVYIQSCAVYEPRLATTCSIDTAPSVLCRAKKSVTTGRVTVLLEFPSTAKNLRILTAAVTRIPAGATIGHACEELSASLSSDTFTW